MGTFSAPFSKENVMPRTSARLRASGYYTNKEPDEHCPSNISYRENLVKVFKKRDGKNCNKPCGSKSATQAISYRPPSPASQSPISAAPSYGSYFPLVPYDTMRSHSRFLMSENLCRPPIDNNTSTTRSTTTASTIRSNRTTSTYRITNSPIRQGSAQSSEPMKAIISALFFLMTSLSLMGAKAKSMMMLVGDLVSIRMKKTCGLLFLLILISLCVWLLFPMLPHFVDFKLPKFLPLQPNTHLESAVEIKEMINLDMQDLVGLISGLGDRIKAVENKNEVGLKPPAPVNHQLTPELQQAIEKWLSYHIKEQDIFMLEDKGSGRSKADKMADFALEIQGARVIPSRCSETYRGSREFVTLFGFTILTVNVSPRTVIQGLAPLLPGRCWSFPGAKGNLAITLSHPVKITHVTVDHVSRYNSPTGSINSAPKAFEIYGMRDISEKKTLLGTFTYNQNGESTQTFALPNPTDEIYRCVEMHILSNWGQAEYTCLYRFRVHGKIAST